MTDREMLELAAKAAGISIKFPYTHGVKDLDVPPRRTDTWDDWNPLADDGDALRLAVTLGIDVEFVDNVVFAEGNFSEFLTPDAGAATRRAILRAAAEIGKAAP